MVPLVAYFNPSQSAMTGLATRASQANHFVSIKASEGGGVCDAVSAYEHMTVRLRSWPGRVRALNSGVSRITSFHARIKGMLGCRLKRSKEKEEKMIQDMQERVDHGTRCVNWPDAL